MNRRVSSWSGPHALRHVVAAVAAQHVEDGIGLARFRDREPDAQRARAGLVGHPERGVQAAAHDGLEIGDQSQQVAFRHGIERLPSAPPERHRLEEDLVVLRPVHLGFR
jgi:hypothetical protein